MLTRRDFVKAAATAALTARCAAVRPLEPSYAFANDIHSQLNRTRLADIVAVDSRRALQSVIRRAVRERRKISIAGARHAMGGQQFGHDTLNLDMRALRSIGQLDSVRGTIEVDAGVQWPELVNHLIDVQKGRAEQWGIVQKQTGADRLTIGGALAANVHGRGLKLKPFVNDVESFTLIDADGEVRECSRTGNRELFALAIGGYGNFGVIDRVRLRLAPRRRIERVVEIRSISGLTEEMERRIDDGYLFGDFQFSIDERSDGFMRDGVFSCYRPVNVGVPDSSSQQELSAESWSQLMQLAHSDKAQAYRMYTSYYLGTSGQQYWSDTHQLSVYLDDYHHLIDMQRGGKGSEIITEIYVPRTRLADFMDDARRDFIEHGVNLFYGTVRLIERDEETFLAWAKQPYACVIFNLHTDHDPESLARIADAFRRLIDLAISRGGSFYLTYHRYARRDQIDACYPQFEHFLRAKRVYDPEERFESDWYRHYRAMYA